MSADICTPDFHDRTRKLQERIDALKAELKATQRDATLASQLAKQAAGYRQRLESGDMSRPAKKPKYEYNEQTHKLELERNRLKRQMEEFIAKGERLNQSPGQKILELAHSLHLFDLFTSLWVYPKLAMAVAGGHVHAVTSAATVSILKAASPSIRRLAELSDRYGAGLTKEGLHARFVTGAKQAPKAAWETLRQGASNIEASMGDLSMASDGYTRYLGTLRDAMETPSLQGKFFETGRVVLSYPGRTHGVVKSFLSAPAFQHSYTDRAMQMAAKLDAKLKAQGMTDETARAAAVMEVMHRETTRASIGAKAVADGYDEKMQGANKWNDAILQPVARMAKSDNIGANVAAYLFRSIFPVVRVGANVVKQAASIFPGGGLIKAGLGLNEAKAAGLSPEIADYVLKNLGAQGTGVAMIGAYLALRHAGIATFGGVPQEGKRDHGRINPEEAQIAGVHIGAWGFHGAPFAMLQIADGLHRVYEQELHDGKAAATAALYSLGSNLKEWTERALPYTDQARRIYDTLKFNPDRGWGKVAGDQLRSQIVPVGLQQAAQHEDPYKGWRKPQNIAQDIEVGLPGKTFLGVPAREQVPNR